MNGPKNVTVSALSLSFEGYGSPSDFATLAGAFADTGHVPRTQYVHTPFEHMQVWVGPVWKFLLVVVAPWYAHEAGVPVWETGKDTSAVIYFDSGSHALSCAQTQQPRCSATR